MRKVCELHTDLFCVLNPTELNTVLFELNVCHGQCLHEQLISILQLVIFLPPFVDHLLQTVS